MLEETRVHIVQEIKLICYDEIIEQDRARKFSQTYISLTDEKSQNNSEDSDIFSTCRNITYFSWICRRNKPPIESTSVEKQGKLNYGATQNKEDWKSILENGCENRIKNCM